MVKYHQRGERSVVNVLVKAREPVVNNKPGFRVWSTVHYLHACQLHPPKRQGAIAGHLLWPL